MIRQQYHRVDRKGVKGATTVDGAVEHRPGNVARENRSAAVRDEREKECTPRLKCTDVSWAYVRFKSCHRISHEQKRWAGTPTLLVCSRSRALWFASPRSIADTLVMTETGVSGTGPHEWHSKRLRKVPKSAKRCHSLAQRQEKVEQGSR